MSLPNKVAIVLDKAARDEWRFKAFRLLLRLIAPICPCEVSVQLSPSPDGHGDDDGPANTASHQSIYVMPRNRRR